MQLASLYRSSSPLVLMLCFLPYSTFPSSFGPILLDDVQCSSDDLTLLSCSRNAVGEHDCVHSEDVVIYCVDSGKLLVCSVGRVSRVEYVVNQLYSVATRVISDLLIRGV
jgi:hypothetical protein